MESKKIVTVTGELDYVQGHLRSGYIDLELTQEEYEKFKNLSEEEQKEQLREQGDLKLSDFEVSDKGNIYEITSSED